MPSDEELLASTQAAAVEGRIVGDAALLTGYEALAASWDAEDAAVRASRRSNRGRRAHYSITVLDDGECTTTHLFCTRCERPVDWFTRDDNVVKSDTRYGTSFTVPELDAWIERHESEAHTIAEPFIIKPILLDVLLDIDGGSGTVMPTSDFTNPLNVTPTGVLDVGIENAMRLVEVAEQVLRCDWTLTDETTGTITLCEHTTSKYHFEVGSTGPVLTDEMWVEIHVGTMRRFFCSYEHVRDWTALPGNHVLFPTAAAADAAAKTLAGDA